MKQLLSQFDHARETTLRFLHAKFTGSKMTLADFEDAYSTAFEKILLDAAKPQPTLTASVQTLCYLSHNALIDMYRKRKREALVGEWLDFYPLSTTASDAYFLEKKQKVEKVIAEVVYLPQRRRQLLEAKYDARCFDSDTTKEEMAQFKSRHKAKNLTHELGFTNAGAMRQEMFRTLNILRLRLRA